MIYPDKIEEKIGFAAIRSQLSKMSLRRSASVLFGNVIPD